MSEAEWDALVDAVCNVVDARMDGLSWRDKRRLVLEKFGFQAFKLLEFAEWFNDEE